MSELKINLPNGGYMLVNDTNENGKIDIGEQFKFFDENGKAIRPKPKNEFGTRKMTDDEKRILNAEFISMDEESAADGAKLGSFFDGKPAGFNMKDYLG